jgi:peptidoglycan DL-endopeptidase LytE
MKEALAFLFFVVIGLLSIVADDLGKATMINFVQPGIVPVRAAQPIVGPLQSDATPLMVAIQPYMGVPYVFGGNTTAGIDCSGFVLNVYRALGIPLGWRTAQTQYDHTERLTKPEIGDLVFFFGTYDARPDWITHVGIVVGDGVMISAIQPRVGRQSLSDPYWISHFAGYGRVR